MESPYRIRPVTTVRHGIDTDYFAPLYGRDGDNSLARLRDRYFGENWRGRLLLGSAGGTDYDKGWLDLVEAAGSLPTHLREQILILVAGDLPNNEMRARVRKAGMQAQVVFPGLLSDVRDALACCHVGFVLSYREALSYACREAMSLGLPVLVSNVGGLPENVRHKENGWIVPARDIAAIARVLRDMLSDADRRTLMGIAARRDAVTHFGMDDFVAATFNVYRQTLSEA